MRRVKAKIKELVSRPTKNLKHIKKAILQFTEGSLPKKTVSSVQQTSNKSTFSLEEEAAQLAYRRGWDIPVYQSYTVNSQLGSDIQEEITPEPSEDKEIIVRERDPMIERLERKISMTEKEGWEALYT